MPRAPLQLLGLPAASEPVETGRLAYVIDDEREVRLSLSFMLTTFGIAGTPFAAAEDFMEALPGLRPGCVIVDMRMPGKDGITMLAEMAAAGFRWPAIVITGHSDVPTAVRAMKLGAIEFLAKPFDERELLAALERGFQQLSQANAEENAARTARLALSRLTPRERDVLQGVVDGLANREIAARFGLSPRTVEMHRANMMRRSGASSVVELISIAHAAGIRNLAGGALGASKPAN